MSLDERERRRRAKRFNEGVKLVATLLNNSAVGIVIAGILTPFVSGRALPATADFSLFSAALVLHLTA